MKKNYLIFLMVSTAAVIVAGVASCSKNDNGDPVDGTGYLKLEVQLNVPVVDNSSSGITTNAPNATYEAADNFSVKIFEKNNEVPVESFENYPDVPSPVTLAPGEYRVVVSGGENTAAAFDQPYYYGSSELFEIVTGKTTAVTVTCTLGNIMVTVFYSDKVKRYFSDVSTKVSNGNGTLTFNKDEYFTGYFNAGPLDITCELKYAGTTTTETISAHTEAHPGAHYHIRINTETEVALPVIIVDTFENPETIIVDLTDKGASIPGYEGGSGELLITEIMYNPKALSDTNGEWLEVLNISDAEINMNGMVLKKGSGTTFHRINKDVILPPGTYAVFGRTISATNDVDYVYSSLNLGNSGDEIIIKTYGTDGTDGDMICSVNYGAEGFNTKLDGKSIQLDPSVRDVESARKGYNWCAATTEYSTGDLGTPGSVNTPCN